MKTTILLFSFLLLIGKQFAQTTTPSSILEPVTTSTVPVTTPTVTPTPTTPVTPSIAATPTVETETAAPKDTTPQLSEILKQLKKIEDIINANSRDTSSVVATLNLKEVLTIPVYETIKVKEDGKLLKQKKRKTYKDSFKITKVTIVIKDGTVYDIKVYGSLGKNHEFFTNGLCPIDLKDKRFSADGDRLNLTIIDDNADGSTKKNLYVYLKDVLYLEPGRNYAPDDAQFTLNAENKKQNLSKSVGINSILEIKLFSDFLAVFDKKPNGLVQSDIFFKQTIHKANVWDKGIYIANNFKFNLVLSKFDSQDQYAMIDSSLRRSTVLQHSKLKSTVSLNLINGWVHRKSPSSYYIDIGGGISSADLKDTLRTYNVTSPSVFAEVGLEFKNFDNMGISLSHRLIAEWSPGMKQFNNYKFNTDQVDKQIYDDQRFFSKTSILFYWNPLGNKSSRIFGRFNLFIDNHDFKNLFYQAQFGYTLLLSNLTKK